jgi:hypothetical protein
MFSKKKPFASRLKYDEKSFHQLSRLLSEGGFSDITIKIPEKGYDNFPNKELSFEEFVTQKYNFVAIILTARKNDNELLKVLFVNNRNVRTSFNDTIFPSSHSASSAFYAETPDPARVWGLTEFVKDLLISNSSRSIGVANVQETLFVFSSVYLLFYGSFFGLRIATSFSTFVAIVADHTFLALVLPVLMIVYIFYYITHPGGVYMGPFEHPIPSFIRRIFLGDLKNNLVVSFSVWLLKIIVGTVLLGLVGNVLWLFLESPIRSFFNQPL